MSNAPQTFDEYVEQMKRTSGPLMDEREWETVIAPNLEEIRQSLERGGGGPDDEAHWALVRKQFTFDHEKGHLNTGTLGASPLYVRRKTVELREVSEREPWHHQGWVHRCEQEAIQKVAALLNAQPGEITFTRNITESMIQVATGLDLRRGDVVVTTNREHGGGRVSWDMAHDWHGVHVENVPIPDVVEDADGLDEATIELFRHTFERYNTPKYAKKKKLLSVSHIFSPLARRMPVKALCALAREYGYLSYVDGAQTVGMIRFDLHDIGCDFYGNSPHKWLLAPKGTGILYARNESIAHLKGMHTKATWKSWKTNNAALSARPFGARGTHDVAACGGIGFAVDFLNLIGGIDRVEARGWGLACRLRDGIERLPGLKFITPNQPKHTPIERRLSGAMTAFVLDGAGNMGEQLRNRYGIDFPASDRWARVSTHYYNTPAQVDRIVQALRAIAGR
ncbi:MAG: aminotransferase class V-fold PLP-dependent enzyme [Candidatus Latescibacteria bacterium]|nr:aminotransferase class V-fold PLP-dependent enzyme [Candidatus Latescibacterota bacterium]